MKLPSSPTIGAQSLGRDDVSAPARLSVAKSNTSNVVHGAINEGINFAGALYKAEQKQEAESAGRKLKRDLDRVHMRAGTQAHYDLDNPDDVDFLGGATYKNKEARSSVEQSEVIGGVWASNRDKIINRSLKGLSDQQRDLALSDIDLDRMNLLNEKQAITSKSKALKEQGLSEAQELVEDGNLADAILLVSDAPYFDDTQQDKIISKLRLDHENNVIEKTQFSGDTSKMGRLVELMGSDEYQGGLTRSQRESAIKDLNGAIVELTADKVAAEEKEKSLFASDLEIKVSRGQTGARSIDDAFRSDKITGAKRTQLYKMMDARTAKKIADATAQARISSVQLGEKTFNPLDPKDRKQANKVLDGVTDPVVLEKFATDFGFIPDNLVRSIESDAILGSGEKALASYMRMQESKPHLLKSLDGQAVEILSAAAAYTRGGTANEKEAIQLAREISVIPKEIKESRKAAYNIGKDALKHDNPSKLKDMMDEDEGNFDQGGIWSSDVSITPEMQAEYDLSTRAMYIKHGDYAVATRMAYENITRNWGITQVGYSISGGKVEQNPKRASRNSPERMLNASPEHINKALDVFAKDNEINKPILIPNANTKRGVAQWGVFAWDEEVEAPVLVMSDKGEPLVWNAMEYMDRARQEMNKEAVQEELMDEGLINEDGSVSQYAQERDMVVMHSQLKIDEQISQAKTKEQKQAVAEDVLTNNDASPEQIRAAKKLIGTGKDMFRKLRPQQNAVIAEKQAVTELWK